MTSTFTVAFAITSAITIAIAATTFATTATAMETLIPQLVAEGWQIVSVSELFKAKGQNLLDGQVYNNAR